jgi:hypothetical protein
MRQSAILIVAIAAGLAPMAARAQSLADRYDPPNAASVAALRGPQTLLNWSGKVTSLRGAQSASQGLRGPELLDTSTGQAVRGANLGRLSASPAQTQPTRIASVSPPQRLPTSLYDNGAAAAAQARPTQPVQGQALAPAAATQTAKTAPAPAAQNAQAAPQYQASDEQTPRYYSLHREYGLQPDPAPPAQPSVLALSPTVASAMADNTDNSPTIDLAGQDQAAVAAPPRLRNSTTGSTSNATSSTSSNGTTTSTYTFNSP